jgi:hypothetical protein
VCSSDLYSIPEDIFDNYNAFGFIPIIEPPSYPPDNHTITHIEVENPITNFGYQQTEAIIVGVDNQEIRLVPNSNYTLSTINNYYVGQILQVVNFPTRDSRLYEVLTYRWDALNNYGVITLKEDDTPTDVVTYGSNVTFYPRVEILGNGSGAKAIPVIVANQIKSIIVIDGGSGYTEAVTRIVDPQFDFTPDNVNTGDERAIVRAILSTGGHGQNIKKELLSNSVLLYAKVTEGDNIGNLVPTTNTYCRIGLVKNPEFKEVANTAPDVFDNRIQIELNGTNTFLENDIATQLDPLTNEVTFTGIVHESSGANIYLSEYVGPYQNVANTDVSFDPDIPIRDIQNVTYDINNHTLSNYVQRTGEVMYIASFITPVTRSSSNNEQYKLILQF